MILAIDPGKDKSGLAVLDNEKSIYYRKIVASQKIEAYLKELVNRFNIEGFVLGDGTSSREIEERLQKYFNLPIYLLDEAYTTMEAEARYRQERLQGIKRILGFISWKPARPLDDYVAVILAERYLEKEIKNK
jgi:RNase H-fold protein (predicted Holliday junction resolvase)